ncbi:MFS general substrate transporter [Trametes sanguinea]|nr:MFS general substrate transporter [Trametes sanguinea]
MRLTRLLQTIQSGLQACARILQTPQCLPVHPRVRSSQVSSLSDIRSAALAMASLLDRVPTMPPATPTLTPTPKKVLAAIHNIPRRMRSGQLRAPQTQTRARGKENVPPGEQDTEVPPRRRRRPAPLLPKSSTHIFGLGLPLPRDLDAPSPPPSAVRRMLAALPGGPTLSPTLPTVDADADAATKWAPKDGQIIIKVWVPTTDDIWKVRVPTDVGLAAFRARVRDKVGFEVRFSAVVEGRLRTVDDDGAFRRWVAGRFDYFTTQAMFEDMRWWPNGKRLWFFCTFLPSSPMSGSQASVHRNSTGSSATLPAPAASVGDKAQPDGAVTSRRASRRDFGVIPIPARLQYDPDHPAHFGLAMNVTFGIASTFVVANLYYCQPLLIQFAQTFGVTYQEVSNIPTLVQAGYAIGLLFITPLGDLVRRRQLLLLLTLITATLSIGLAITKNLVTFEVISFLVGIGSVVPQILMPLAADLAPPERRASALSIVLSGLLLGVLIARVLAGVVAQFVTWRVVYYIAIGVQYVVLVMLYYMLPDYPPKNKGVTYFGILYSMAKFTVTEPLLVQAILITIPSSACFTNWWVTLTFLLGGPPYNYSTLHLARVVIGLFGVVGIVGVACAPFIGRIIDKLVPWSATLVAIVALTITFTVQTAAAGLSVAAVVIVTVGLDIFRQTQQVSLTTAVLGLEPNARSRLNAVLLLSLFIGQVMGTSVGAKVFNEHGWRPDAALNLSWTGFTLFVLFLRGPHCPRYKWIGWEGGFELRKSRLVARQQAEQDSAADRQDEKRGPQEPVMEEKRSGERMHDEEAAPAAVSDGDERRRESIEKRGDEAV